MNPDVMTVLKLRQAALRVTGAKIERGLDLTRTTDRLQDLFTYHQAHTGRWSSRRMQLHNLPRGIGVNLDAIDGTLASVDAEASRLGVSADDVLACMIRPTLLGPFVIADYAQVELRCVAWMSGDRAMLGALKSDPYIGLATQLGIARQLAKVIVLGSIYGMSGRKFAEYCDLRRIDLGAMTADEGIKGFRAMYPEIPKLWKAFDSAAKDAIAGKETQVGRCVVYRDDDAMVIRLPSNRRLFYRQCRLEERPSKWDGKLRDAIVYQGPHGERVTYGSSLVENADQATCRDLLADALIRCEDAGLRPVAHVHDEILCETSDVDAVKQIMEDGPPWAKGFPILVEAKASERYAK